MSEIGEIKVRQKVDTRIIPTEGDNLTKYHILIASIVIIIPYLEHKLNKSAAINNLRP